MIYSDDEWGGAPFKEGNLTEFELSALHAAVDRSPVSELHELISPRRYGLVDHHIYFLITIARASAKQEFSLEDFDSADDYPPAAKGLMALIDRFLKASQTTTSVAR
jgi:hypothetical protein